MQLNDLSRLADEQDAGHSFELRDPVQGEPLGIRLTIAGPDSKIANKARAEVERSIAHHTRKGGEVPPRERQRIMDDFLAAVTLGWDAKEDGQDVPFSRESFQRLLDAGQWVRGQVDLFAGDRSPYFKTV